ncbi:hypothetical protein Y11_27611 [Yersinia enterocolitica subsp. palearctica Y11]|uniref:Uncharacterized protein n=1 Tax=Yersinia enterocolitica subsp. palearctica serotype O:3 (strain DSM 13030 / CIP 106945 / Y11) TaxID=930944 RepID=A0A0H3NM28_YERE1|nr:hypothetical protein Y11_27611 [Yersinia enterocolitica subsp. palearctica Y11]CCO67920.1 hypothetical protein D322_1040 [Yersinia enterocolitica IP 10393]
MSIRYKWNTYRILLIIKFTTHFNFKKYKKEWLLNNMIIL